MLGILLIMIAGLLLGYFMPIEVNESIRLYLSLMILVSLSSLLEILANYLQEKVNFKKWTIEIASNLLLSTFLVFLSLRLSIPFYYAIIIYFGSKIFDILGKIRYFLLQE